jgi:proteasome accessory factor A
MVTDQEIEHAQFHPPTDTRAYFRGECLRRFPDEIAAASWDSLIFDLPGKESLVRVPTMEPTKGTKAIVGELLASATNAAELVELLGA